MNSKRLLFLIVIIFFIASNNSNAQGVSINENHNQPDPSAMLDIQSSDKGLLIPRLSQNERDNIPNPAEGLMIYQTDNIKGFYFYDGNAWSAMNAGSPGGNTGSGGELISVASYASQVISGGWAQLIDLVINISLDQESDVLIIYQINGNTVNQYGGYIDTHLEVDGVQTPGTHSLTRSDGNSNWINNNSTIVLKLGQGNHTIRVMYFAPNGSVNIRDRQLTVKDLGLSVSYLPPVASFTTIPNPVPANMDITFDGSSSSHPEPAGSIIEWEWDFEDDGYYDAYGETVQHNYGQMGFYTAKLRVKDNFGNYGETIEGIMVDPPNQPPVADFTASPNPAMSEENILFDASASYDPNDYITTYRWDWDMDGIFDHIDSNPTANHSFFDPGFYDVILQVEDSFGETNDAIFFVEILF
ncbi:MAG: PKD domain-containing protein [Bacteroidales bacterium]|nr:PKD domain-containing protein [Bacteroidales bacterium]